MAPTRKPEELLEEKLKNLPSVADEEVFESAYPLLLAYYEGIRKMNKRKNKFDIIKQNKELERQFIFLCEHNLLFFLTVIGRFDLIRELYKPHPQRRRPLLHLLHLLRVEHEKNKLLAAVTPMKMKKVKSDDSDSGWLDHAQKLSFSTIYFYHQEEINRITAAYHERQNGLLLEGILFRLGLLNQISQVPQINENLSLEQRQEYEQLLSKFDLKKQLAMQMVEEVKKDPTNKLLKQQCNDYLIKLYNETTEVENHLKSISNLGAEAQQLYEKSKEKNDYIRAQFELNEQVYKNAIEELDDQLKEDQRNYEQQVDKNFEQTIDFLEKCSKNKMNGAQKASVAETIEKLTYLKEVHKIPNSFLDKQTLLKNGVAELDKISGLLKSVLPTEELKKFTSHQEQFKQEILESLSSLEKEILTEYKSPFSMKEEKGVSLNPKTPVEVKSAEIFLNSPLFQGEEVKPEKEEKLPMEVKLSEQKGEGLDLKHVERDFKAEMKILREEPVKLGEDLQKQYKEEIDSLWKNLKLLQKQEDVDEDDMDLIKEILELIKDIKDIGFDQVQTPNFEELFHKVEILEKKFNRELLENKNNLYSLSISEQPKAHI